jgi:hypothetical protein
VRSTESAISRYTVGIIPTDSTKLPTFLAAELKRIEAAINNLADGQLELITVAPDKPREGMIRFAAAGVLGATKGFYGYHTGAWTLLG